MLIIQTDCCWTNWLGNSRQTTSVLCRLVPPGSRSAGTIRFDKNLESPVQLFASLKSLVLPTRRVNRPDSSRLVHMVGNTRLSLDLIYTAW
jgi:hypothetical protein